MPKTNKRLSLEDLKGLYKPTFERENCGIGLIAHIQNKPSKEILDTAIKALCRMSHRGGLAADGVTGDGCGLLLQKPDAFFRRIARQQFPNQTLNSHYAVGQIFLSPQKHQQNLVKSKIEEHLIRQNLQVLGWRPTPVDDSYLGEQSKRSQPNLQQIFVNAPAGLDEASFNRSLYVARRFCEMEIEQHKDPPYFYICSLHSRTISYKGLMMPLDLPKYYLDLSSPDFIVAMCSYHQRFSTNTLPQWHLAQPFRYIAHNGEINSIQGNRNWAQARAKQFHSELLPELNEFTPIVSLDGSDSCSLDNMLETLVMGGLSPIEALRLMIPPATKNDVNLNERVKAYFDFHSHFVEPWDGPAGIFLHDGRFAVCSLDRNGLRPARYIITKEGIINFASEIGVFDYEPEDVVEKGRLRPGQMICCDVEKQKISYSEDIINQLASQEDYVSLVKSSHNNLEQFNLEIDNPETQSLNLSSEQIHQYQKYFNVSFEELDQIIRVLAEDGLEATGSMGDDAPLPVFSAKQRSLFDFFRQVFAQVTNPPIDSLRENIIMSLETILGSEPSIFSKSMHRSKCIKLQSPLIRRN